MPDVGRSASVLIGEIIRIRRESSGTVAVAVCLAECVIDVESRIAAKACAQSKNKLILIESASRIIFEIIIDAGKRTHAAGWHAGNECSWQRCVDSARAQQMKRARMAVGHAGREVMGQRAFDAGGRLHRVRRAYVFRELIDAHRLDRQGREGWNVRKRIQQDRISNDELFLINSVQPVSRQRQTFADPIVENAEAAPNCGLGRMLAARRPRGPGKTKARRKIQIAADVALIFVTKPEAQRKIRPEFPIILSESAKVPLAHSNSGNSRGDRELSCAAAGLTYLRGRQPVAQTLQSYLISPNAGQTAASTGKCPGSAKVLWRDAFDADVAEARAESQSMRSHRHRGVVRDLETVLLVRCEADLRAAAGESVLNRNGGNRVVGRVIGSLTIELKASLVDGRLVENRGFCQPDGLLRGGRFVLPRLGCSNSYRPTSVCFEFKA